MPPSRSSPDNPNLQSLRQYLASLHPRLAECADQLEENGVTDVDTLLCLTHAELCELLDMIKGLLPLHKILLSQRHPSAKS